MTRIQHRMKLLAWSGAAMLLLAMAPATIRAEILVLRNDTPMAVVIQVTSVWKGQVQRTKPILLIPRGISTPITLLGNKQLVISDASVPTRILFKDVIPGSQINKAFSIQPNPPRHVKLQQIPHPNFGLGMKGGFGPMN